MTKKITTLAMFAVLMVIGGYFLYFISRLLPIPGGKFIVMGPYLTCVMILPLLRYPKFGTLSMINVVFGGIMVIFNPWMTLAIIVSGILADLILLIPLQGKGKLLLAMGVYNGVSLLVSVWITNYVTGKLLFKIMDMPVLLLAFSVAVITGIIGGYAGLKLQKTYLKLDKSM
ncbi:MAG: hypothetical protein K0S47_190 [Herbinix sp.]|jgi:energy-coupling factor transport system substrate-specific component|nr:hypothetical protein [Herbinix sp.]